MVESVRDPEAMASLLIEYLEWLKVQNYSEVTVTHYRVRLGYFIGWCEQRGMTRPQEVSKAVLKSYQRHLYRHRKHDDRPLSFSTQHSRLDTVRGFFKWLSRNNYILYNPAFDLEMPKLDKRIPRNVLSASEAERVLNGADINDPLGLRDRAVLETLYSTGMRRKELIGLKLHDLDVERGTVMIREGKGKKDRMIPIGDRAVAWIEKYLREVRPELGLEPDEGVLFLMNHGKPFTEGRLSHMVHAYVKASGIAKTGSCHMFRHTMATLMLENGADIRFIQQMLGHEDLSTTQVYTRVSIRKLKEVHSRTHPSGLLRKSASDAGRQEASGEIGEPGADENDACKVSRENGEDDGKPDEEAQRFPDEIDEQ